VDHLFADRTWGTIEQLIMATEHLGLKSYRGGYFSTTAVRQVLRNNHSVHCLMNRKDLDNPSRVCAATDCMLIVLGTDRTNTEAHAVCVDTYRRPPVFFSGNIRATTPLTVANLASMKYPIVKILTVVQMMVRCPMA
jgi:hypothetical protein